MGFDLGSKCVRGLNADLLPLDTRAVVERRFGVVVDRARRRAAAENVEARAGLHRAGRVVERAGEEAALLLVVARCGAVLGHVHLGRRPVVGVIGEHAAANQEALHGQVPRVRQRCATGAARVGEHVRRVVARRAARVEPRDVAALERACEQL